MGEFIYNIRKIVALIYIRKIKGKGTFKGFYPGGGPKESIQYKNGKIDGEYCLWYPNGKMEIVAEFKAGKFDGRYRKWDTNADLQIENRFSKGTLLETVYEKGETEIHTNTAIDEASLIQKTAKRIATMLLIVSKVPDEKEKELFDHVKTVLKRYAFLEISDQDLFREIETLNEIFKDENGKDWLPVFRTKLSEFSKKILHPHERQNLLRIALAIALFDRIDKGTQSIMGIVGESLGYTVSEFEVETGKIMKEFGIDV